MEKHLEKLKKGWSLDRYNQIVGIGQQGEAVDFTDRDNHFIVSCDKRINQLRMTALIMTLADLFNGQECWQPEAGELGYYLDLHLEIFISSNMKQMNFYPFKTSKDAENAAKILRSYQDEWQTDVI